MAGRIGSGEMTRWRILHAIDDIHAERSTSHVVRDGWPSSGDIAERLGLPVRTVRYYLRILEKEGSVERQYGGRAVVLLRPAPPDPPGNAASETGARP